MRTSIVFVSLSVLAACGGKSSPATTTGGGGGGAPAVGPAPGIHGCSFTTSDGYTFGPHRCDVIAGDPVRVEKLSGMELFSGTLAASGAGATLTAEGTCEPRSDTCGTSFVVELAREGDAWRGKVVTDGQDWWLAHATFEITDLAGYGGDSYGGDGYGGAMYGGGE